MSEETKKAKKVVEKPEKAKSSSALTSKEAPGFKDVVAPKEIEKGWSQSLSMKLSFGFTALAC